MSNTHHSSPLEEARRLLAELIPHAEAAVIGLSANPSWRQRLDVFASDRGFAADPGGDLTIARQAALLELLIMLKLELNGERDDSTAKKRARVQAKPQSLLSSLNALDQERYSMDPLTEIIEVAATPSALDVSELTTALSAANYEDVIGPIYEEVVPQAERRKLGQFWTPRPIADLMARWCIRSTTARVLDPASGSGALLLASLERLLVLGADEKALSEQLHGNEVDPLVRALMLVTLSAYDHVPWERMELADALTARSAKDEKFDSIICNPPYTRHHHLPEDYKALLKQQLEADLGVTPSGFTSLFAYFFLHCLTLLGDRGRMAFITPAELYDAAYAKPIKRHVLEHVNLKAVIVFGDDFAAFPGVDTAGAISFVEGGPCDNKPIRFVELDTWPGIDEIIAAVDEGADGTHSWGRVESKSRKVLANTPKWTVANRHRIKPHSSTVPLGSIANIMRGIATGNNAYFTLTETEREETEIEDRFLLPFIGKTRDCLSLAFTQAQHDHLKAIGKKVWLFYCQETPLELTGTAAERYIQRGVNEGVPAGALVSLRGTWYQVERRTPPALLYTYLSRGWPRFISNDERAQNLNGFHSITPIAELCDNPTLFSAFCAILNSEEVLSHLRSIGRSYGGGTVKVEPRELDRLPVFDPRQLPPAMTAELAKLFAGSRELSPNDFARTRDKIDNVLRKIR